jgi:hypothetical protein
MSEQARRIAEALLEHYDVGTSSRFCDDPPEWDEATVEEVAAVVEEAMGNPWIPVSERVPSDAPEDRNGWVIVSLRDWVTTANYSRFLKRWDVDDRDYPDTPPDHWMPFPAPPPA